MCQELNIKPKPKSEKLSSSDVNSTKILLFNDNIIGTRKKDTEIMIVFCSNCGEAIPEDVNFCQKCGVQTMKGAEEKVPIPRQRNWEKEFESAIETIGEEMEKAFSIAGSELKKALHRTKEKLNATEKKGLICTKCGETNRNDTNYCYKCGTKLNG